MSSREIAHHDFFIGKNAVRVSKKVDQDIALKRLGAGLVRPFSETEDPLVDRLHEVEFFDWLPEDSNEAPTLKHGEVYCPLDGPVIAIKASERTPSFSWQIMCGREWTLYLCPKCLGIFERFLYKMS